MPVEIRILGPVEAAGPRGPVRLAGRIRPAVIGILALRAGQAMTREQLAEGIWGPAPPPTALRILARHLCALRDRFDLGIAGPCCTLDVDPETVDAHRFAAAVSQARAALRAGDACGAARSLETGLSMWRGDVMCTSPPRGWAAAEAAHLRELRLLASQVLWQAKLGRGETDGAVAELERLVAAYPLQERLWELLMVALAQTGRRAEALGAFARLNAILHAELDVEPSSRLCRLHDRVTEMAGR